jgi:radical SAM superfamily enzyme YgiQ (UPF0313 family)
MQYSLSIIQRKSLMPPLGLLTIAAMTPAEYEIRLVDLNTGPLTEADLEWADLVLMSAMLVQKAALISAAQRCRAAGKLVVLGGPYPTSCPDECRPYCDALVLNEGEVTWPLFLRDLEAGELQSVYSSEEKPDITRTPTPRFDLLKVNDYVSIPIQFSRGLSLPVRVLRHYRDVREKATRQNARPIPARTGWTAGSGLPRTRFHR